MQIISDKYRFTPKFYMPILEEALMDNMQQFLLELGKGFYNYILKCIVLVDLKADKLTHQDVGQMEDREKEGIEQ